jgi:sensor histidine kinase YesM
VPVLFPPAADYPAARGKRGKTRNLPKSEGGTIKLTTQTEGNDIKIIVEDDGVGFNIAEKKNDSIGIDNVRMRAKYLLGTDMKIESEPGRGTRVEILIPSNYAGKDEHH